MTARSMECIPGFNTSVQAATALRTQKDDCTIPALGRFIYASNGRLRPDRYNEGELGTSRGADGGVIL